ncbi:hypothetical protein M9H77_28296 [Catharanthus roseus]|uniref:Uncharacterized protein n=1 Tax=Catharanthus roseus TaxID=4058 RepID=A0ACC0AEZ7_CATRO|nr:hypothetical protein M9H77_28296 [Catharanthus roseus]
MFAPVVRLGAKLCKPYIQRFATLGHKSEHKLIDLRIRLDMMTADEVRWTPYKPEEITDPYMPDRIVRQFGRVQCIPSHPIRSLKHRRPANNKVYMVKNVFIEELWLEAPSHLLMETWTSVPTIPPSWCTDDYMPWFLPRTHPRIQNPERLPCGVQLPSVTPISL